MHPEVYLGDDSRPNVDSKLHPPLTDYYQAVNIYLLYILYIYFVHRFGENYIMWHTQVGMGMCGPEDPLFAPIPDF